MLERLSLRELSEWEAYDRIEPIGMESTVTVLSLIGSLVASATGAKIEPSQFTPWRNTPAVKRATGADVAAFARQVFGG